MGRAHHIDLAAPMRSLRETAGITIAEMARRRGVKAPSIHDSERDGAQVRLASLVAAAAVCGLDVEIRVRVRE